MDNSIKWSAEEDKAIVTEATNFYIRRGTDYKDWRLTPSLVVHASIMALPKERTSLVVDVKDVKRLNKMFMQSMLQFEPGIVYSEYMKFVALYGITPYEVIQGLEARLSAFEGDEDGDDDGDDEDGDEDGDDEDEDEDEGVDVLVVADPNDDLGDLIPKKGVRRIMRVSKFEAPVVQTAENAAKDKCVIVVGANVASPVVVGAFRRTAREYYRVPDAATLQDLLRQIEEPNW